MLVGNGGRKSARRRPGTWGQTAPCFQWPCSQTARCGRSGHLWHCSKSGAGPSNRKAPPFFAACFQILPKYICGSPVLLKSSFFRLFSLDFLRFKTIVSISPPFVQHRTPSPLTESSASILYIFHNFYSISGNLSGNENRLHFSSLPAFSPASPGSSGRNCRLFHPLFSGCFRCPVLDCTPCPPAHFAEARSPLPFRSFPSFSGTFPSA